LTVSTLLVISNSGVATKQITRKLNVNIRNYSIICFVSLESPREESSWIT